jgi:hypothetical protein
MPSRRMCAIDLPILNLPYACEGLSWFVVQMAVLGVSMVLRIWRVDREKSQQSGFSYSFLELRKKKKKNQKRSQEYLFECW